MLGVVARHAPVSLATVAANIAIEQEQLCPNNENASTVVPLQTVGCLAFRVKRMIKSQETMP